MKNDEQPATQTSYRYRFGTAEFDEARFELRVAGLPVEVERRALEVLAYLLRHAGEVVTKEELFREVWAGRITVDKVLPNAIAKLRRALGEANADLLLTQPRIGYRLDGTVERIAVGRTLSSKLELAPGQAVPGRVNFQLKRLLGSSRGNEVWLAEHAKTRALRVYKFCTDGERLRALKREATLARVLQEGVEDHRHFVELIDWNFETQPFFLECEYGGDNLLEWAKTSLAARGRTERLGLFLQIADAVATAHGIGVLHKDLKPANVLIAEEESGPSVRLTDFGSGRLLDPDRLEELGITGLGLTVTQSLSADSSTGTPLYLAPEVIAGHTPTVQSDVYALGVLLYQLLAGDLSKPMASGWEADISDDLLSEDIRAATHGNPAQRVAGAAELAGRLRNLDLRREQTARLREVQAQARVAQETLARSRARRPYLVALVGVLVLGVLVTLGLYKTALDARNEALAAGNAAQRELERANAINRFLNEDLISRSNPLVMANGAKATLKDVLLGARGRIEKRFTAHPLTQASVRTSLAALFSAVGLVAEAENEVREALPLYERELGSSNLDTINTRSLRIQYLARTSKFDAALAELQTLDRATAGSQDPKVQIALAKAWGGYYMMQSEREKGLLQYQKAIALHSQIAPGESTETDAMRFSVISALTEIGRLAEARREAQGLLDEIAARDGDNALASAVVEQELGKIMILEGDLDAAETRLLGAQKIILSLLGPEHNRAIYVLDDLSRLAARRKNWPAAIDYARREHEMLVKKYGADSNLANHALMSWGEYLHDSGNLREAEEKLATAHSNLVAALSADNTDSQYAAFQLAAVRIELGRLAEADKLLATLDIEALSAGDADPLWGARLDALHGLLLSKRGDSVAAESVLRAAAKGFESKVQTEDPLYRKVQQALSAKGGQKAGSLR